MINRRTVIIVVVIIIVLMAAGFLLWRYKFAKRTVSPSQAIPTISPVDVGKDISNKIVNPSLPQTNPFGAQTNPFKNVYKNPF